MLGSGKNSKVNGGVSFNTKMSKEGGEKTVMLTERSVYIEGVKVLQRQERISYLFTLLISLTLVILLFIILHLA
jgi:hypothetical protein